MTSLADVSSMNYYHEASKGNKGSALAALIIAIICLICPWRSYIDAKVDKSNVNSKN
jgi:hypothetical protein